MKQQRRFFLKVLAAGPLVGCAGAASEGSLSGGDGGSTAEPAGSAGSAGSAAARAGSGAGGGAGSPSASGGGTFVTGGRFGDTGSSGSTGGSASGAASSGAPSTGSTGGSASALPGTPLGNVSSYAIGSLTIVDGMFFLGRDADGVYVMSMQCTHKGCVVALAAGQLKCTCHESRFDSEGNVLQGPATTPLPHYAVYVDAAGNLSVDRFTVVSVSTRVAV